MQFSFQKKKDFYIKKIELKKKHFTYCFEIWAIVTILSVLSVIQGANSI